MSQLVCKRLGCSQTFESATNTEESCRYHEGWPTFKDTKKTWYVCSCLLICYHSRSCCGKGDMDWDEFLKQPGCCIGPHSVVKPERPSTSATTNAQESTSVSTPQRLFPSAAAVPVEPENERERIEFISANGLFKCRHAGCMREYDPRENIDGSCQYHPGTAGFKDTRKFWSCCNASSYDWDEFLQLPKCITGIHQPKLVYR